MNNTNIIKHAVNRLIALLFIVVFVFAGMVSCGKTAKKGLLAGGSCGERLVVAISQGQSQSSSRRGR